MIKTKKRFMLSLWAAVMFIVSLTLAGGPFSAIPAWAEAEAMYEAKGKVKGVSNKARTISLSVKEKGPMIFKFNDQTQFIHADSARDFKKGEGALIKYKMAGPDMVAVSIKKAISRIPQGVSVITTPEVAKLVKKGPQAGNYRLIDSRPARRYSEGHIPTALSVPFMQLKKKGMELLPPKGKTLIFYCGGPT
ncbi:MAG: rhodanese-like domain-containing protein [Deltaproteobacteria bacterium]|nr:rhodanese-like domain-containing protein [Deltaproteobacteria bacterium]MCF8119864.1 rhodanese-like domain-containing protein [Deltaproteobacteria bacterium]